MNKIIAVVIVLLVVLIWNCSNNGPILAGPVTVAGNPKCALTGVAHDALGNPVAGAGIFVYKIDASTNDGFPNTPEIIAFVYTNGMGQFQFVGLRPGTYTLDGSLLSSNLFATQKDILFDSTALIIDTLVLKKPGIIKGVVKYDFQTNSGYVQVNVEGLYKRNRQIMANHETGEYEIDDVPEGLYTIGFYSYDYINQFVDSVHVVMDSVICLDTIFLQVRPDAPPPKPHGFTAQYDTAGALVTLKWNSVGISSLAGYKVMRKIQSGDVIEISPILTDTFYVDSIAGIPNGSMVMYLVKSIDKAYNESLNAGPVEISIKN